MYCHKCGNAGQRADTFCRNCGNYLPDVDKLVKKFVEKNSPEAIVNKSLLANVVTILFAIFTAFSIALIFAGETFSIVFIHLAVFLSFIIGGWQAINLKNNLKLRKLLKDKKLNLESSETFKQLSKGSFYNFTMSEILDKTTSGSLSINKK